MSATRATFPVMHSTKLSSSNTSSDTAAPKPVTPRRNPYAPPGAGFYASASENSHLAEKGQNLVTMVLVFLSLGQVAPTILIAMGRLPFVPYGIGVVVAFVLYRALYKGSPFARKFFLASVAFLLSYLAYLGISLGFSPNGWLFLGLLGAVPALVGLFFWKTPSVRDFFGVD